MFTFFLRFIDIPESQEEIGCGRHISLGCTGQYGLCLLANLNQYTDRSSAVLYEASTFDGNFAYPASSVV